MAPWDPSARSGRQDPGFLVGPPDRSDLAAPRDLEDRRDQELPASRVGLQDPWDRHRCRPGQVHREDRQVRQDLQRLPAPSDRQDPRGR